MKMYQNEHICIKNVQKLENVGPLLSRNYLGGWGEGGNVLILDLAL